MASKKSRGRYANLWGDFWRHGKVQELPLASVGLLAKLWSRAADKKLREGQTLTKRDVEAVLAGNSRNRSRLIKPLENVFVKTTANGLVLLGWGDNNPIAAADDAANVDDDGTTNGTTNDVANGHANDTTNAAHSDQRNQQLRPPLSVPSPKSQVPSLRSPQNPQGVGGSEVVQSQSETEAPPEPEPWDIWVKFEPGFASNYLAELAEQWPGLSVPAGRMPDAARGLFAHFSKLDRGERAAAFQRLAKAYRSDRFLPTIVWKFLAESDLTKVANGSAGPAKTTGPAPPAPHSAHGLGEVKF